MSKFQTISADTKGLDASIAQLRALADEPELRSAMDTALAAGGRVVADEWKIRAPAQSLKDTFVRKGITAARALNLSYTKLTGVAVVSFRGAGYRLAHLFEFGTSERIVKTTGQSTGRMPPQPFARPGVDAVQGETEEAIKASLQRSINRMAKKKR